MNNATYKNSAFAILESLSAAELLRLSPAAAISQNGVRRNPEKLIGYRQNFAQDADRILHSRAYTRYIDKTQVFCLIENDHITHRVLHVQLVSRIARTIGRFLYLNEDLIEAIALGHDIGHPPFGHAGESFLAKLCLEHGLPAFQHNIQSVRALDRLERKGRGWNLTLHTLDGILCHDGETHAARLYPKAIKSFTDLEKKIFEKSADPKINLQPMSLEGCVVRLADTVAYIGRDIEDAIVLGLIKRSDIPARCIRDLGESNGSIVYSLVTDLICHSNVTPPKGKVLPDSDYIGFSETMSDILHELKQFNYKYIYLAKKTQQYLPLIEKCYRELFFHYLEHLEERHGSELNVDLMSDLEESYTLNQPPAARVRDFIAGMTDDFFLQQAKAIGCTVPVKT